MDTLPDLTVLPAPPAWMADGICAQVDPDLWFPDKGGDSRPAKTICTTCPVRTECLDYALDHNERFGIWGGASERERRALRRKRTRPRHATPPSAVTTVLAA